MNAPLLSHLHRNTAFDRNAGRMGRKGFSLVELLVVVAVVGVIAGIAIPALAAVWDSGLSTRVKRQAQTIAQMYAAARAAGATFPDYSREGIVDALSRPAGVRGSGVFQSARFAVPMSSEEAALVRKSSALVTGTGEDGTVELYYRP